MAPQLLLLLLSGSARPLLGAARRPAAGSRVLLSALAPSRLRPRPPPHLRDRPLLPLPSRPAGTPLSQSARRQHTTGSAERPPQPHPAAEPSPIEKPDYLDPAESAIWDRLYAEFAPADLQVRDVSGGCGSMYSIDIASDRFRGCTFLKQQRMVNAALGDMMKTWHGVQLRTREP